MLIYFNFRIFLKGLLIVEAEMNVKIDIGKCRINCTVIIFLYFFGF